MSIDAALGTGGATISATVLAGPVEPAPLPPEISGAILRVVVDTHARLPDMFEITFTDPDGTLLLESDIDIGAAVEIRAAAASSEITTALIRGEVTAIEAICEDLETRSVVRGFDKCHRLQRIRHTRVWLDSLDSEIALELATEAGLEPDPDGMIPTEMPYPYVAQVNQTDWEFLQYRAAEIGYEVGVDRGLFYFRPAPGGALGAAVEAAQAALEGAVLKFKKNLITFLPSVTAANMAPMVEARLWDSEEGIAVVSGTATVPGSADLDTEPELLTAPFVEPEVEAPPPDAAEDDSPAALDAVAPPPDPLAYVVADRPVESGPLAEMAAEALAQGVSKALGSTFAEAEGYAEGDPKIRAGVPVEITGVPARFAGSWMVTNARHTFEIEEGGYYTRFWVSGQQDRTLLGLTAMGGGYGRPPRMPGLACGIVTQNNEAIGAPPLPPMGRVKFALPWLDPAFESDWARVVQLGAGSLTGALFLPQVGDEVLVGFEMGDVRRPYVLGGLINARTIYHLDASMGGPVLNEAPGTGTALRRGFIAPSGNRLLFVDAVEDPDVPADPAQSSVYLGDELHMRCLTINEQETPGTLSLYCGTNIITLTEDSISVACLGGDVSITGGSVNIEATEDLSLTAPSITIAAEADISIDAPEIGLNSP
jgi:phage protein D